MTVLNLSYGGFYGGAKTGFQFKLVGVDRTDNAAWFNARAGGIDERDMKQALRQGGPETLNLDSSVAGGYLGYAYLPGLPDARQYLDGIVFHWESMVGTSTSPPKAAVMMLTGTRQNRLMPSRWKIG